MPGEPFIGEIMLWTGSFVPVDWAPCDGRRLSINENYSLYSLVGNAYGGDNNTFALPNLRGSFVMGTPAKGAAGNRGGSATSNLSGSAAGQIAINPSNLPSHTHGATFTGTASTQQASVTVAARQAVGGTMPQDGFMLGEGSSLGAGAASIYVPPDAAGANVSLAGGGVSLTTTPAGAVAVAATGQGAPLQASLPVTVTGETVPPYVTLNHLIALRGIYPQRP